MENTLPLPLELIFETLSHCNVQTIWNFAETSQASYLVAFRILAVEHRFPVSLPHAIRSGLAEKHKSEEYYDRIDTVAIDVTQSTWEDSHLLEFLSFLTHRREIKASANVKIYSYNECCSIDALATVFGDIFVGFYDVVNRLAIHVEVAQFDEGLLIRRINRALQLIRSYARKRKESSGGEGEFKNPMLASLDLQIKAVNPRTTTNLVIDAIQQVISPGSSVGGLPGLEDVKIVVKWKDYASNDAANTVRLSLSSLESKLVRKVWLEDKNWSQIKHCGLDILHYWPNTEELRLDGGLGGNLDYYTYCRGLENLRTLSIPFPYAGSLRDGMEWHSCCLRSLFRSYISQGFNGLLHDCFPLREIIFHYLTSDGLSTNYTKVKIRKHGDEQTEDAMGDHVLRPGGNQIATDNNGGLPAEDLEEGEIPGEDPFALFTMEDLGDKPTDPIDLSLMRELMLKPALREDERQWIMTDVTFLKPFMNELAAKLMAAGDQLEHWRGSGDSNYNPGINRRGFKCTGCNCIA
ncbi:hypothetical protein TWF281_004687 [Arthrobotrys megalospora]